jgi:hypothetical protein
MASIAAEGLGRFFLLQVEDISAVGTVITSLMKAVKNAD